MQDFVVLAACRDMHGRASRAGDRRPGAEVEGWGKGLRAEDLNARRVRVVYLTAAARLTRGIEMRCYGGAFCPYAAWIHCSISHMFGLAWTSRSWTQWSRFNLCCPAHFAEDWGGSLRAHACCGKCLSSPVDGDVHFFRADRIVIGCHSARGVCTRS